MYRKEEFNKTDFLPGYNFMMAWDIALGQKEKQDSTTPQTTSSTTTQPTTTTTGATKEGKDVGKGHGKRRRGQRKKDTKDKGNRNTNLGGYFAEVMKERDALKRVFVGFEYECHNGHRFLLNDEMIKTRSGHKNVLQVGKIGSLPLFLKSPTSGTLGQLQRIFVVTPKETSRNPQQVLVINPIVEFIKKPEKNVKSRAPPVDPQIQYQQSQQQQQQITRYIFRFQNPIILTWDSCLCFRLPYIYTTPQGEPLIQHDVTSPYMVTLLDNVIYRYNNTNNTVNISSLAAWPALPTYATVIKEVVKATTVAPVMSIQTTPLPMTLTPTGTTGAKSKKE